MKTTIKAIELIFFFGIPALILAIAVFTVYHCIC